MLRPSPVPLPTSLIVKKGSKTRSRTSGGIPQPLSVTDSLTYDPGPATAPSSRTTFRVSIFENAAIRHGVAPIQSQVEESSLQQRRVGLAQPQSGLGSQLGLSAFSPPL